jgi:DNA-binding GntR family transcriptional regulator
MSLQQPTVQSVTVTAAIASKLRDDIRFGKLAPGERLRQMSVARDLNVSTTSVREAFMLLEREGLVARTDRRGAVVFNPTVEDLVEIFRIRTPLETLATEAAVPNLTEQDLDALERLLTDGEHAHAVEDVDASLQFGDAFHATLYRRCGMPRLVALIENLISAAGLYVAVTGGAGSMRPEIVAAHRAIFDACKARDAARAADAMRQHLSIAVDVITRELAARRVDGALS